MVTTYERYNSTTTFGSIVQFQPHNLLPWAAAWPAMAVCMALQSPQQLAVVVAGSCQGK